MEQIETFKKSRHLKTALYILGATTIALLIFQAGMFVGYKKASFSFQIGEQYFRQMTGEKDSVLMGMNRGDFGNSHGTTGKIISMTLPSIVVSDRDGNEKDIIINPKTDIRKFKNSIEAGDLKVNDLITVIGEANDNAEIEAKLIRVMPDPGQIPQTASGTNNRL